MTGRRRSKINNNQTRKERSSASINQCTETRNNKNSELKVQQLEINFSLVKQKPN